MRNYQIIFSWQGKKAAACKRRQSRRGLLKLVKPHS
jgi:hypothetical protein